MAQPEHDFAINNQGTIVILTPVSPAGEVWADSHLPEDKIVYGGGVAIEHRCIDNILDGIAEAGLKVSRA